MRILVSLLAITSLLACSKTPQTSQVAQTSSVAVIGGQPLANDLQTAATVGVYMHVGYCSGSYIGNDTVITASHCIHGSSAYQVRFNHPEGIFSCNVTKQVEHPDYAKEEMPWYDIAVLKISCADEKYKDIIPYVYNTNPQLPVATYAAGYGLTSQGGSYNFPNLSFMELKPFDMNQALQDPTIDSEMKKSDRLDELVKMVDEGRIHCYSSEIKNTVFFGDSGGPHYADQADGRYLLLGVNDVLYTKTEDVNTLYSFCAASVAYYKDWVDAQ